ARPAATQIYTLSLHDALPIFDLLEGGDGCRVELGGQAVDIEREAVAYVGGDVFEASAGEAFGQLAEPLLEARPGVSWIKDRQDRSEEHTSELQSRENLVCRLL